MTEEKKDLPTKEEVTEMVNNLLKSYQNLPPGAMMHPATQYDIQSVLLLFLAFLRSER